MVENKWLFRKDYVERLPGPLSFNGAKPILFFKLHVNHLRRWPKKVPLKQLKDSDQRLCGSDQSGRDCSFFKHSLGKKRGAQRKIILLQ
jgi:hypothetical protein